MGFNMCENEKYIVKVISAGKVRYTSVYLNYSDALDYVDKMVAQCFDCLLLSTIDGKSWYKSWFVS